MKTLFTTRAHRITMAIMPLQQPKANSQKPLFSPQGHNVYQSSQGFIQQPKANSQKPHFFTTIGT